MTHRKEFIDIIEGWSLKFDLTEIPKRLEKIKKLEPLSELEQQTINFMKEVQATREQVRKKPVEERE